MKPYRPEILEFVDPKKSYKLQFPQDGDPRFLELGFLRNSTRTWPEYEGNRNPKEAVFVPDLERIVLLGGLGDPGLRMGAILIVSFDGEILAKLNATSCVPNLEETVRENRRKTNFPWLLNWALNGTAIHLKIVGGKSLVLDVAQCEIALG